VHFDRADVVEIEGILTEVAWRNPHIQLTVVTRDEDGSELAWLVEESNRNVQVRRGVTADDYQVGEIIRVAGFRGLRNRTAVFATNTLLANGRELLGSTSSGPRWTSDVVMTLGDYQASKLEKPAAISKSLFRVWSVAAESHLPGTSRAGSPLWKDSYPLTEQAQATLANWNPVTDNPYLNCEHGMPAIMDAIAPMEFAQEDPDILLRLEEQDVIRRIHMGSAPTKALPSPYGHSVGHWEDETLVVVTTAIDWPWFDQSGVPQSEALRLVERFSVTEDGLSLDYSVKATDTAVFTEPVVMGKRWTWIPAEDLEPYNCSYERDDL
jgi:hypothetical protein